MMGKSDKEWEGGGEVAAMWPHLEYVKRKVLLRL
jgi:hypothetical protein